MKKLLFGAASGQKPLRKRVKKYRAHHCILLHTTSNQITKEIIFFLKKAIPNFKFIFIEETFDIGKYFKYKDKQKTINYYNVIDEIKCNCGKSYIGQTERESGYKLKDYDPNSNNQKTDVTKHILDNPDQCFFKVWLEEPRSNFEIPLIFFLLFLSVLSFVYTIVEADFERPLDNFERPFRFLKTP